jgi:hypothetical protein
VTGIVRGKRQTETVLAPWFHFEIFVKFSKSASVKFSKSALVKFSKSALVKFSKSVPVDSTVFGVLT